MKKITTLMLALMVCMSVLLVGCSSQSSSGEQPAAEESQATEATQAAEGAQSAEGAASGEAIKIGIAMSEYNDKWLSYMLASIQETAAKYEAEGVEFMFADGGNDVTKQVSQVENFISSGCNAIIIVPVNTDSTQNISDMCDAAGVKLIAGNRQPTSNVTSYIGSESIISGRLEMEYLAEKAGGKGKVVILMGQAGQEAAVLRTQGFEEIIANYPDIEVVAKEYGDWTRDKARTIVENWIQAGLEFDIIASNNDEMAIGAILALQANNIEIGGENGILIGGIDGTADALPYVKDGTLAVSVFQNPMAQGSTAVEVAVKAARGETVEEIYWVDYELIPPEKVDEYMAIWES